MKLDGAEVSQWSNGPGVSDSGKSISDSAWHGDGDGNSHVNFPTISLGGLSSFTVAMWVNLDDANNDLGWFSYGRYASCGFMCQIRVARSDRDIHCRAGGPGGQFPAYDSNKGVVGPSDVVNKWAHFAVVKDNAMVRFYVNGAPVGSRGYRGGNVASCSDAFRIGGWPGDSPSKYLDGRIDVVRVFKSAKSSAEILSLKKECEDALQRRAGQSA